MRIGQDGNTKDFSITPTGSIQVSSIKNKTIFDAAKVCDTNKNQLLENKEIAQFIKKEGAIKDTSKYTVYYEKYNKNGTIHKRSILSKIDNSQMTFIYRNGEPLTCSVLKPNGERHLIYFEVKAATVFPDPSKPDEFKKYALNEKNLQRFKNIGLLK